MQTAVLLDDLRCMYSAVREWLAHLSWISQKRIGPDTSVNVRKL